MKVFNEDSPHEQQPDDNLRKKRLDSQGLLILFNLTDLTLRN